MNEEDAWEIARIIGRAEDDGTSVYDAIREVLSAALSTLGDRGEGEGLRIAIRSCLSLLVETALIDHAGADPQCVDDDATEDITSQMMETLIRGIARALEM